MHLIEIIERKGNVFFGYGFEKIDNDVVVSNAELLLYIKKSDFSIVVSSRRAGVEQA